MKQRITDYSIGGLARLSGVTVRTLHHYDEIGLLCPGRTGRAGYRRYGRRELERFQDILFYRAAGIPLAEIAVLLAAPGERLVRLKAHQARLRAEGERLAAMQAALDEVIAQIEKGTTMTEDNLYTPFSPATQAAHEDWLRTYGRPGMSAAIETSKKAVAGLLPTLLESLRQIEGELAQAMRSGLAPGDAALAPLLEQHRALIARFWGQDCPPAAYAGLGELYTAHPGFGAHFDAVAPGLSGWLPTALAAHAARLDS